MILARSERKEGIRIHMRAFIYAGGEIFPERIEERPNEDDLKIAADSGYKNALAMGIKPDILIGDFDSIGRLPDDVPEVLQLPEEKDYTDTQTAVETAISRGANEIIIIGGTGGRFDHALSSMCILESLCERHIQGVLVNGQNRVRYLKNSSFILLRSKYKYFSLIAADPKVKGVSIDGAKYPLKNKTLERKLQFAVSNEISGNCALISVNKGGIYIIESHDL